MKSLNIVLKQIKKGSYLLGKSIFRFVYPSTCLHCQNTEVFFRQLLCSHCMEFIERIPPHMCNPYRAVAVYSEGVAISLVKELHGYAQKEILMTMASCMLLQFLTLKWPIPSAVIAFSGNPFNTLLAQEFSSLLSLKDTKKILSDEIILVIDLEMKAPLSWSFVEEMAPKEVFWLGFCSI